MSTLQFFAAVGFATTTASICDVLCQTLEMNVKHRHDRELRLSFLAQAGEAADPTEEQPSFWKSLTLDSFDFKRTLRYAICPGFCAGVASYVEIVLVLGSNAATDWFTVLEKTFFDCLVYYPMLIAAGFFINLMLLDCKGWAYLREKYRQDFLITWLGSCCIWIPVDIVVFKYVQTAYQVYIIKCIDVFALLAFSYFINKNPYSRLASLHSTHADVADLPRTQKSTEDDAVQVETDTKKTN